MSPGRPRTRFALALVAAYFLAVSAWSCAHAGGLSYVGDGTLFLLAALGHAAGFGLALVYGGLALARRSIACSRLGAGFVVAVTLALMGLYALYFMLVSFTPRLELAR